MIKGDAYGHGCAWVAKTLSNSPGLYGFGVAALSEVENVRSVYKGPAPIYLFSNTLSGISGGDFTDF